MKFPENTSLLSHLTYKGNLKHTRYGWLRLTPAYSVHLVSQLLDLQSEKKSVDINPVVLDPFCGTGTTALVCAERGIEATTTDINPFLIWLAKTKTRSYNHEEINDFQRVSSLVAREMLYVKNHIEWLPSLHQIEKWWDEETLRKLSSAIVEINIQGKNICQNITDLLKLAFCRMMIERASVSFAHQSMSFKKNAYTSLPLLQVLEDETISSWKNAVSIISQSAKSKIITQPQIQLCDARVLSQKLESNYYSCVITSPPYPNRMSYIRELRPYMYWLGYLQQARDAGELDWKAIGGTWGCATSNLNKWKAESEIKIPYDNFYLILEKISQHSELLARYVHKYFYDMVHHSQEVFQVVKPGGFIYYIVGNSKFYDVLLPVESIFAAIFESTGFVNVSTCIIRKRTSKKELFEYLVSAQKPRLGVRS